MNNNETIATEPSIENSVNKLSSSHTSSDSIELSQIPELQALFNCTPEQLKAAVNISFEKILASAETDEKKVTCKKNWGQVLK